MGTGEKSWIGRRKLPIRRLLERVEVDPNTGCWLFKGTKNKSGYTVCYINKTHKCAHRLCYELLIGVVPKNLDLDHLCRIKNCINPNHLEPVTRSENIKRANKIRISCKFGHILNHEVRNKYGKCKICDRNNKRNLRLDPIYRKNHNEYCKKYYYAKKRSQQGMASEKPKRTGPGLLLHK